MDITSVINAGLTSSAAGGLFGLIGSFGGRLIGIWEAGQKRKDQAAAYAHELNLIREQSQARAAETEHELELIAAQMQATSNAGTWAGLSASIEAQTESQGVSGWVKDVLALVRPALTLMLMLAWVGAILWLKRAGVAATAYDQMMTDSVGNLAFVAMTALSWWFGDRAQGHTGRVGVSR